MPKIDNFLHENHDFGPKKGLNVLNLHNLPNELDMPIIGLLVLVFIHISFRSRLYDGVERNSYAGTQL